MNLLYLSNSFFPFAVPEMDSSFAPNVGPQTVYPAGFTLGEALQIYWRAQDYQLIASGNGTLSPMTQTLGVNGLLPPRNAAVGTNSYREVDGFMPAGPEDFVVGRGMRVVAPGVGTVTSSGPGMSGTNSSALFNLQVNLFYPEISSPYPLIRYGGMWWPAMSVSCAVTNTVSLDTGGALAISYNCTSFDPAATTEIGLFSFFGILAPVYGSLEPGETRTFYGSLTVAEEWA